MPALTTGIPSASSRSDEGMPRRGQPVPVGDAVAEEHHGGASRRPAHFRGSMPRLRPERPTDGDEDPSGQHDQNDATGAHGAIVRRSAAPSNRPSPRWPQKRAAAPRLVPSEYGDQAAGRASGCSRRRTAPPVLGRRPCSGRPLPGRLFAPGRARRRRWRHARAPSTPGPPPLWRLPVRGERRHRRDDRPRHRTLRGSDHRPRLWTDHRDRVDRTLRDGRWAPLRFADRFAIYGRESRLEITYDYTQRIIQYRGRSETFLLRRIRRMTDDTLAMPAARTWTTS